MDLPEAYDLVLNAATKKLREHLGSASNYERLNQPKVVSEVMENHYKPLKEAIDLVSFEAAKREVKGR